MFDKDNKGQNDEIPHLWNHNSNSDTTGQGKFIRTEFSWPMPEYLSKNDCLPINPPGDGNCLYKSCLICINDNTTSNKDLRNELNRHGVIRGQKKKKIDSPPTKKTRRWART